LKTTQQSKKLKKFVKRPSELRQDLVSLDWIAIATGRAKRPHAFAARQTFVHDDTETCPFDNLEKSGNEKPTLVYGKGKKNWSLLAVPNKYPAFTDGHSSCPISVPVGPHNVMEGVGFHEVFILKDHFRNLAELPTVRVRELLHAYRERYLSLKDKSCVNFISIFHNHGREAGASLTHPHSQLIALPIIPPDVRRSLEGSERYYLGEKKCVHCVMLAYELKTKSRVVFENSCAVVVAPYASHAAFELRVFPKSHQPHFETMSAKEEQCAAEALKVALWKLFKGLGNPSYNYFLHTAPTKSHQYDHYHWHIEVVPKTQVWAGFEIGTGIEISTIAPENAAKFLRSIGDR